RRPARARTRFSSRRPPRAPCAYRDWRASRAVSSEARDYSGDASTQDGQHLALEPRVTPSPRKIAPARMRQRQEFGQVFAVRVHRLGERALAALAQIVLLGAGADEH